MHRNVQKLCIGATGLQEIYLGPIVRPRNTVEVIVCNEIVHHATVCRGTELRGHSSPRNCTDVPQFIRKSHERPQCITQSYATLQITPELSGEATVLQEIVSIDTTPCPKTTQMQQAVAKSYKRPRFATELSREATGRL